MAYSVKEVRSKVTEMMVKDDKVTLEQIHKKLSEASGLKVEEVKSVLAGNVSANDDIMKKVYEALDLKDDIPTPPAGTPPVVTPPKDIVEEALKGIYGATSDNPVAKKLAEIKTVLEKDGVSPETRKFLSEMTKSIIEIIPLIAEAKSGVVYEQKISATVTKEIADVKKSIDEMKVDIKTTKGVTETLKNAFQPGKGKSLNEQSNQDVKIEDLPKEVQDDLYFAQVRQTSLKDIMSSVTGGK